jgi:PAS domain S-box-containing protein
LRYVYTAARLPPRSCTTAEFSRIQVLVFYAFIVLQMAGDDLRNYDSGYIHTQYCPLIIGEKTLKIKTKLELISVLSLIIAIVLAGLLLRQFLESESNQHQTLLDKVLTGFLQLNVVTGKYLLEPNEENLQVCHTRIDEIESLLARIRPRNEGEKTLVERLQSEERALDELLVSFDEISRGVLPEGVAMTVQEIDDKRMALDRGIIRKSQSFVVGAIQLTRLRNTAYHGETLRLQAVLVTFVCVILMLLGVSSVFARRTVVRPINALCESVEKVASGDLEQSVAIDTRDELGDLARSFNKMSRRVRKSYTALKQEVGHRRQIEQNLRESEKRYRRLVDTMNEGLAVIDVNNRLSYVNDRLLDMLGYRRQQLMGRPIIEFAQDERQRERLHRFLQSRHPDDSSNHEIVWKHADGHAVFTLLSPVQIFAEDGGYEGSFAVITDISRRRQVEAALENEKERLAVTLKSIGEGVITTDIDGKIFLMNQVAETITGWKSEEAEGESVENILRLADPKTENPISVHDIVAGDPAELADYIFLPHKPAKDSDEDTILSLNASPILDDHDELVGGVLVFRDVTAQRNREEESIKGQKLESVGLLAGGIAHDFNNILTVVLGNVSLARALAGDKPEIIELLQDTERASIHARYLTQQLLTFSKGGEPVKETVPLGQLVPEAVGYVLRGTKTKLHTDFPQSLWDAEVDVGQIFQVFQNLVINAAESMQDGGTVTVSAENKTVFPDDALPLDPGPYIRISVEDEGCGIAEDDLSKVFDPYFTTKRSGTGLGLATAYSIVKKHGGYIGVESTIGKGTRFDVYLSARRDRQPTQSRKLQTSVTQGEGRILVMDDDRAVRELLRRMLPSVGYEVEAVADGDEAVEAFKAAVKAKKPFDAVILDLMVPGGVGGRVAAERILKTAPESKLIVSSGYSNDPIMAHYAEYGFVEVVSKPYNMEELSTTLARVIEGEVA